MIKFIFKNHSNGIIETDNYPALMELWEQFSYYVPGYRFMPAFERGTWDGKIRLINISKREFPIGLTDAIIEYCKDAQIEYKLDDTIAGLSQNNSIDEDTILNFIKSNKYWSKQNEIFPRDDQINAIIRAIQEKRCVNICPTSFGKSLCIFIQSLWYIKNNKKIVIIVPSVNLVRQFKNDIIDYCTDKDGCIVNLPIMQEIYSGKNKEINEDTNICITTWQSIYKLEKEWINQFDCIILDEAHKASAQCLRDVFNKAETIEYRTGWTGSLKGSSLTGILVESLIGKIKEITNTATLMEKGVVADLIIQMVRFNYDDEFKKQLKEYFSNRKGTGASSYTDEIKFLETHNPRNNTIINMAGVFNNTGLILYTHRAHGNYLYEYALNKFPNKNIYKIDGYRVLRNNVVYKTYEELKPIIEEEKDAILICSFGVFSTGISIKNLHYIMFSVPIKSYVRTIQSIGRGLRISKSKTKVMLIDIIDDLRAKNSKGKLGKENYAYKHFKERFAMYAEQKFKYNMISVNI